MSYKIEVLLFCDVCGEDLNGDDRYLSSVKAIRVARKKTEGWVFRKGKDYCPKCIPKKAQPPAQQEAQP